MTLSVGRLRSLFSYDPLTGQFRRKISSGKARKGSIARGSNARGYIFIPIDGKTYPAQRLAWLYCYGEMPLQDLDHINRDRADNRIANLRLCTKAENARNATMRGASSGLKGVYWRPKPHKWVAIITADRQRHFLGSFDSSADAARAYNQAAERLHGEFACLNNVGQ